MKSIVKFLTGMALALALSVCIEGPAQAYTCAFFIEPYHICGYYTVDLIPGARWCGTQASPGAREVMLFVETGYANTTGYCQIVSVYTGATKSISDLSAYNMAGPGTYIRSVWQGSSLNAAYYPGVGLTGTYKYLATGGFDNNVQAAGHFGFLPKSIYLW